MKAVPSSYRAARSESRFVALYPWMSQICHLVTKGGGWNLAVLLALFSDKQDHVEALQGGVVIDGRRFFWLTAADWNLAGMTDKQRHRAVGSLKATGIIEVRYKNANSGGAVTRQAFYRIVEERIDELLRRIANGEKPDPRKASDPSPNEPISRHREIEQSNSRHRDYRTPDLGTTELPMSGDIHSLISSPQFPTPRQRASLNGFEPSAVGAPFAPAAAVASASGSPSPSERRDDAEGVDRDADRATLDAVFDAVIECLGGRSGDAHTAKTARDLVEAGFDSAAKVRALAACVAGPRGAGRTMSNARKEARARGGLSEQALEIAFVVDVAARLVDRVRADCAANRMARRSADWWDLIATVAMLLRDGYGAASVVQALSVSPFWTYTALGGQMSRPAPQDRRAVERAAAQERLDAVGQSWAERKEAELAAARAS